MSSPAEVMPWAPEGNFFAENATAIEGIARQLAKDFPGHGAEILFEIGPDGATDEQMAWMWPKLMGRQHGVLEGRSGKLVPELDQEGPYMPHVEQLHYGPYSLARATPKNEGTQRTKDFVAGGTPAHIANRLGHANAEDVYVLAGQRALWNTKGEVGVADIYRSVGEATGVNVDALRARSPFTQAEERKLGNDRWTQPFADETALARLIIEGANYHTIDWANYPVTQTAGTFIEPRVLKADGADYPVPARDVFMYSYHLKDGGRLHVVNAAAVQAKGNPRPNTDSQLAEAATELTWHNERVGLVINVPHIRAGVDGLIRATKLQPNNIVQTEIVAAGPAVGEHVVSYTLGELPATEKAHRRLRAHLAGQDPDAPALAKL